MSNVELLPLPGPMQVLGDRGRDAADAWCRANIEANTEALRAVVERLQELCNGLHRSLTDSQAGFVHYRDRAERLAEALREIERRMPKDRAGPAWIARTIAAEALHPINPTIATRKEHDPS